MRGSDGLVYGLRPKTPGVDWGALQEGQRFRCLVTLLPTARLPLALAMPTTVPSTLIPRPWLVSEALVCAIHRSELSTLPGRKVRQSANMTNLIRAVGKYERERGGAVAAGDISRNYEPASGN